MNVVVWSLCPVWPLLFCVCFFQFMSELRFDGFSLRSPGASLLQAPLTTADHKPHAEVSPVLVVEL